jgi:hypothetical protein
MGKHLYDIFPVMNGMNKGGALSASLSSIASRLLSECRRKLGGFVMKWNCPWLVSIDINLLGENIKIIRRNAEDLWDATEEFGVEAGSVHSCVVIRMQDRIIV